MRQDNGVQYWESIWHIRCAYRNPKHTGPQLCQWLKFRALGGVSIMVGMKPASK